MGTEKACTGEQILTPLSSGSLRRRTELDTIEHAGGSELTDIESLVQVGHRRTAQGTATMDLLHWLFGPRVDAGRIS
jgi:hypothetical protein